MTLETVCYKTTIPIIPCKYHTLLIVQGDSSYFGVHFSLPEALGSDLRKNACLVTTSQILTLIVFFFII